MRTLLLMVRKDLLRRRRVPLGYLVSLSFPVVFALLLALAFGGGGEVQPRVHLLVENRDGELLAELLTGALQAEQMAQYFQVELVGEEGVARMEKGEASALLVIPEGFTDDLLAGRPVALPLVRNPAQSILPEAAEEAGHVLAELLSAGSRVLREPLDALSGIFQQDGIPTDAVVAALAVSVNQAVTGIGDYVLPPVITLETATLDQEDRDGDAPGGGGAASVFLFILPGISVFALFVVGDLAMRDLLEESVAGTLRRQLSGPVNTGTVVAAKALYAGVLTTVTLVLLSAVGWMVSPRPVSLAGFVLLSAALVIAVTGLAALVYGLSGNPNRGSTLGTILYLGMAMLGGSFVPLGSMPDSLRAYAPLSLFYWANDGYFELLQRGAGVAAVLPQAGLLAAAGAVLLVLGAWWLGRQVRRGVTA